MDDTPRFGMLPFWSWNDELQLEELQRQISWMHQNGIGGFFMHARSGLSTPYLGDKWMEAISFCTDYAKSLGMEPYVYDENGWPSGFVGGKLLENLENHDRYLTAKEGPFDPAALASYSLDSSALVRVTSGERVLNVYEHYSPSTADVLNPKVVDQFLEFTHERYQNEIHPHVQGFFTDEPQYFRYGEPYTPVLEKYFEERYGEDIKDGLGYLFLKKEGYEKFRYRYYLALNHLLHTNYAKRIYSWCTERGYEFTGHYIEETCLYGQMWCCGGIMPMYEYQTIPGIDALTRYVPGILAPKQVGSVAAQLGKKRVIVETYAAAGWDFTPREAKRNAEAMMVNGVNLLCPHLIPYSERGDRSHDYPAHYSPWNPWVKKGFQEFSSYFAKLGEILSSTEEIVHVGVLHPIRSCYLNYSRTQLPDDPYFGTQSIEDPFQELLLKLTGLHIPFHLIDETLLEEHGHVENGQIILGKCSYSILIVPSVLTIASYTSSCIDAFLSQGGKILFTGDIPSYLDGEKRVFSYSSNTSWEEILSSLGYRSNENPNIRLSLRKDKESREFFYAVAIWGNTELHLEKDGYSSLIRYDLTKGTKEVVTSPITIQEGDSCFLAFCNEKEEKRIPLSPLFLPKEFELTKIPENTLVLDRPIYSLDGSSFSTPRHVRAIQKELLQKRHKGKVVLRYEFLSRIEMNDFFIECELHRVQKVSFNGVPCSFISVHPDNRSLGRFECPASIRKGANQIEITMDYFQDDHVYEVLSKTEVTEGELNCLTYDSSIEAIYLRGRFGVFGEFKDGNAPDIIKGRSFYLDVPKKRIRSLIKDGYPFFSGEVSLQTSIDAPSIFQELRIEKRFQLIEIDINGRKIPSSIFDRRFNLSPYIKEGKNELRIILTISRRNELGPFHSLQEEDLVVSPESFEIGIREEKPFYHFVKTII
ncbi:MAG: hypothetical protein SPG64_04255 [Candidatus Enteromonas sp.]|nr:hypothetical protein [Candidatus Enteromonas sp.]